MCNRNNNYWSNNQWTLTLSPVGPQQVRSIRSLRLLSYINPTLSVSVYVHCVSKKRHPFYICYNFVRGHPILPILGRNIHQEIWNKSIYTAHHTSFHYVRTVPCKIEKRFLSHAVGLHRQIWSLRIKVKLSHQTNIKWRLYYPSKCLKSRPSVLTQARSRPRHIIECLADDMLVQTRRDHAAIRRRWSSHFYRKFIQI